MDTANKEKIINKLEEVFNIATDRYINSKGQSNNLKEIESLGSTILSHRKSLVADLEKTRSYINATVQTSVQRELGKRNIWPTEDGSFDA